MAIKNADGTRSHEGRVLAWRESNRYDDSDWYALVWDAENRSAFWTEYATTRCAAPWYDPVDATPEVQAAYQAWAAEKREESEAEARRMAAGDPDNGKAVVVVKGNHRGKEGTVFWRGANTFRTYYRNGYNRPDAVANQRLGIECPDGTRFFTALDNVRVKGFEDVAPSDVKAYFNVRSHPGAALLTPY